MKAIAVLVVLGALVGGCATKYQAKGFTGGFDEVKLSADTYRVSVNGNGYTSNERAKRIALLRAADLTVENGYERFIVMGGDSAVNTETTPTTMTLVGRSIISSGGGTIQRPENSLTFRMLKKGAPGFDGAMDAKLIAAQLRPQLT